MKGKVSNKRQEVFNVLIDFINFIKQVKVSKRHRNLARNKLVISFLKPKSYNYLNIQGFRIGLINYISVHIAEGILGKVHPNKRDTERYIFLLDGLLICCKQVLFPM